MGITSTKPQTVHLYNITEKGNFVGHGAYTHDSNKTKLPNTSTISQSKADVKYEQAVYEGVDLKINFNDPELERLYNIQQTTNLGTNKYGKDFDNWVEDKLTKDVIAEIDRGSVQFL